MPASGCATVTATYEEVQAHLLGRLHVPQRNMMKPQTWNSILATMSAVRDAHGWSE